MGPRFDPASYPGRRPDGPALVVEDRVWPLRCDGPARAPLRPARAGTPSRPDVLARDGARFVVAYGSNASPSRLMDKRLTSRGAVLLPAVVHGWVAAFEARRTGYGAVPLTFVPSPGAVTHTWVVGLHPLELELLDRTEGRVATATPTELGPQPPGYRFAPAGAYQLGRVGDVEVAGRFRLEGALAYLPGPHARVQTTPAGWRTWPEHDQTAAANHVDAAGPWAVPPEPEEVVLGPWPPTPLRPLGDPR